MVSILKHSKSIITHLWLLLSLGFIRGDANEFSHHFHQLCTIQISVQGFRNIANSCSGIMHLTINDMPTLTDNCVKVGIWKLHFLLSPIWQAYFLVAWIIEKYEWAFHSSWCLYEIYIHIWTFESLNTLRNFISHLGYFYFNDIAIKSHKIICKLKHKP